MFEIAQNQNENTTGYTTGQAKIRVIGIGGGGGNAVNTMIQANLLGVDYVVANTDAQALASNLATNKIQMGAEITKGLGAGANPEIGRKAALEEYEKLSEVLTGADMVFITAGMGGGTGTGAAPVVAKLSKELGALTVGVVTRPFIFEGRRRARQAEAGIKALEEAVDSLITIPNQRLLYLAGEGLSLIDTFKKADEVLLHAVQGISDLINNIGLVNADFADVRTIMANQGLSLMGTGMASGENRAVRAAREAINSPLLEDVTIEGATGLIINITGSQSLTTHETNEAISLIMEVTDEDAEIIFGAVFDEEMGDDLKVTVIATGLGENRKKTIRPSIEVPEAVPIENNLASEEVEKIEDEKGEQEEQEEQLTESVENIPENNEQEDIPVVEEVASDLSESIKQAAKSYEESTIQEQNEDRPQETTFKVEKTKARSIAEKLGFINFGDDEYDTPTFLRKDSKIDLDESRPN